MATRSFCAGCDGDRGGDEPWHCCQLFLCTVWDALGSSLSLQHHIPLLFVAPRKGVLGRGIPQHGGGEELGKLLGDLGSRECRGKGDKPAGNTLRLKSRGDYHQQRRDLGRLCKATGTSRAIQPLLIWMETSPALTGERWCSHVPATKAGAQSGPQMFSLSP